MTNNSRDVTPGIARIVKNFDNYSKSNVLTPHRSMKLDAVAGFEDSFDNFRITKVVNTPSGLYGAGTISNGDAHAQVYQKVTPTNFTDVWTTANSGSDASNGGDGSQTPLFMYYKNQDMLYGRNFTGVWSYKIGTTTFKYNEYTAHVPTAQGLVHSKDDIMYVPSSNLILRNNAGTWDVALTLPVGSDITSIFEKENFLGIAANQADGTCVVYEWDRDSTLVTTTEKIDFGVGTIKVADSVGGLITCIITTSQTGNSLLPKVQFKYWTGSEVKIFQEFDCSLVTIPGDKQKFNNITYFLAEITTAGTDGEALKGVWKIYKKTNGAMTVSFDRLPRNDTALNAGSLKGFYRSGDYMFVMYLQPANLKYTIWRTDDQANYLATSVFQTVKFNQILGLRNKHIPDSSIVKKLVGVTLNFEPLTSGQSAGVKYRIEGETSWTTIFTCTTVGVITHSAINIEGSSPTTNLRENKEIEFQLFSVNGAAITGFEFTQEVIGKRIY